MKKSEIFANTSDLVWNPKVAHILAASSDSGVVSVIDLRSKKEVIALVLPKYSPVSAVSWNPETVSA